MPPLTPLEHRNMVGPKVPAVGGGVRVPWLPLGDHHHLNRVYSLSNSCSVGSSKEFSVLQSTPLILAGLGLAIAGLGGKLYARPCQSKRTCSMVEESWATLWDSNNSFRLKFQVGPCYDTLNRWLHRWGSKWKSQQERYISHSFCFSTSVSISLFVHVFVKSSAFSFQSFSKYYKGGFEPKMTKREAGLILGVRWEQNKSRVKSFRFAVWAEIMLP